MATFDLSRKEERNDFEAMVKKTMRSEHLSTGRGVSSSGNVPKELGNWMLSKLASDPHFDLSEDENGNTQMEKTSAYAESEEKKARLSVHAMAREVLDDHKGTWIPSDFD